jgi:uncharacterized protein YndB with AHSA1/START domain
MSKAETKPTTRPRELVITRLIDAPHGKLFRCWTEPALIVPWFTPPPWKAIRAEMDVRPGGSSLIVMQGPDGTEVPNPGIHLDVVKNKRLVSPMHTLRPGCHLTGASPPINSLPWQKHWHKESKS